MINISERIEQVFFINAKYCPYKCFSHIEILTVSTYNYYLYKVFKYRRFTPLRKKNA